MLSFRLLSSLMAVTIINTYGLPPVLALASSSGSSPDISPWPVLDKRDAEVMCVGDLPTQGYPVPWEESDFANLNILCEPHHVGCRCSQNGMQCPQTDAMYQELYEAFADYCRARCFCYQSYRDGDDKENVNPNNAGARLNTRPIPYTPGGGLSPRCPRRTCWSQNSCSGSCGCSATSAGTSVVGASLYRAHCGFRLSPRLERRDDPPNPCPCNCTYVSFACCSDNSSGLVYEDPSKDLGILQPPDRMCCNTTSGEFQYGHSTTNNWTAC